MRMNKKTIISLALCIGVFFMAVGYSILMTELKINGSASISSTWDIRVTGITETSRTGSAYNIEEPSYTIDTAKFNVALVDPGDSISFKVTIANKGTLTAILNSIDITTSGTESIIYEVTGLADGDTLASGQTKTLNVTARYAANEIADPNERVKRLKVGLDWVQYTNQTITPKTYTISYNSNGGTGSMSNTTCTVGTACTLTNNAFTRNGYKFLGWSTTADGPVVYNNQQTVNNLTSGGKKVTLYAVWKQLIFGNFNSSTYATLVAVDLTNDFGVSVYFDVVHNSARKLILGNYPSDGTGLTNFNIEMTAANQLRVYQGTNYEKSYDITAGVHNLEIYYSKSSSSLSIYLDESSLATLKVTPYTSASKTLPLMVGKDSRTGTSPFTTYMPVSDISFTSSAASYNWELTPEGYVNTLTNTKATLTGTLTYYTY